MGGPGWWLTGRGRCNAMGSPDASQSEMPGFSPPSWPGRELGEPLLDALLDGRSLPPDAREEARVVAEMLAELAGPAEPGELAGEAGARVRFARSARRGSGAATRNAAPAAAPEQGPPPAGTAKAAGRARRKAKRTRRTRELAELQRLRQGGLLSSNEAGPHRLMPAEEAAVSTYDHYTTPVEPGTWDVPTAGATRFSWEYDGGRSRLLDLYQRGKDKQWDAAKRIDWSIPVDPPNVMDQSDELVPIHPPTPWHNPP